MTIIYYGKEIAFEVVLDCWREIGVSILIVKYQNGKIPDGYYVDKQGSVIRKYLIQVIKEQKLELSVVHEIKLIIQSKKPRDVEYVKLLIDKYKYLLEKNGKYILELGEKCLF